MKPILNPLDQTSEFAVVGNTVCDSQVTIQSGNILLVNATVDDLDLNWAFAINACFGSLTDHDHSVWVGDFTGRGRTEILFNYSVDGYWWLGAVEGTTLTWTLVAITCFGNLLDGAHAAWQGDFTGVGRTQILFYYRGDGNWWLGTIHGDRLDWQLVDNTAGFGDLLDGRHSIWIGNFTGGPQLEVLFYFADDGNWFLGTISGGTLSWSKVGNTGGFGNLLDGAHDIWIGKFSEGQRSQVLFYYREDGHWFLGTIQGTTLIWTLAATALFGDLTDGNHPLWLGDFTGAGRTQVLFYYGGDGHWWLGTVSGAMLTWTLVATTGFGNLLDGSHRTWQGRFAARGKEQLLFYYRGDGHWWLGDVSGATMSWTRVANTAGFGDLLDGAHAFWQGGFCGNGLDSLLFYYAGDGNWWHGRTDGRTMRWWLSGNSRSFGNLLDGDHPIWSGCFSGSLKSEVLFYYAGDGNFFLGQFDGARFQLPRLLEPGETLVATQRIGAGAPATSDLVTVSHNFATQHYDRQRTGWNFHETTLTRANVGALHKLYTLATDDQVYTQPLYVQNVQVAGVGTRNVIYVATERDTVYAFDADSNRLLLSRSLLRPCEMPVPSRSIYSEPWLNIYPVIGITGTPVIDRASNSLFVVSKTKDSNDRYHQRLYSLDLDSLGIRPCVAEIAASSGGALFDALASNQRPALLLSRGLIYIGFGSHGDQHPQNYFGWLLAFDARTLNLQAVFNAAPVALGEAGIWQSGHGPAADRDGNVYFTTGNGSFDLGKQNFSNAVMKLGVVDLEQNFSNAVMKLGVGLERLDFFAPINQDYLNRFDMDLGSGGVIVLPDQNSTPPRLALTGGKQGYIYLLDRDHMGGHGTTDNVTQRLELYPGHLSHEAGNPAGSDARMVGMFGGPAYFRNAAGTQFVYLCGTGGEGQGQLVSYRLESSRLTGRTQSSRRFPSSGTPAVTSHGGDTASAVVWMLDRTNPLKLVAFNSDDLTQILFQQDAGPWNNPKGTPFLQPTVIAGKVYVPSAAGVTVFALG